MARAHGVETMFTLSGAHVFPMYDGAVKAEPPMRLLDVRHEQTAAFAAEATGKLTRRPGLAVLTAGPGVTNGVSAIAQAQFAGSPMVVVGGRAPQNRWGSGILQELDQPPIIAPIAKLARTLPTADEVAPASTRPSPPPARRTEGRCSSTCPWTSSSTQGPGSVPVVDRREAPTPTPTRSPRRRAARGRRPAGADPRHRRVGRRRRGRRARPRRDAGLPAITNGMGRGVVPGGHPLLVTKARGQALSGADLVVVVGTPLDFRLGYGVFGGKDGGPRRRAWCTWPTRRPGRRSTPSSPASAYGDLSLVLDRPPDVRRPARAAGPTGPRGSRTCRPGQGRRRARRRPARGRGRPDPPGPHLRRARAAAGRRRGGDRRRRRLRLLRGQVRRAEAPRRLARPRALRLPRRRPRRGDRRPDRAAVGPGDAAARRRRGRASR